jgi:predicted transcriptional regulator
MIRGTVFGKWLFYIISLKQFIRFMMALEKTKADCPKIYSKELVEIIFENPYSKIDFLVRKLNINRKTASKYLKELEENNFLSHVQIGKELIYINNNLMETLKANL